MNQIERDLRYLKTYAVVATLVCGALFAWLIQMAKAPKFQEIDVERINIVEADGRLRMVLSNKVRQHPGVVDGVTFEERRGQRPPGLMFFSEKGDEVGGLVFDGETGKGQGGSLTFDKFRGDQTVQFIHDEEADGTYFAGLKMSDQNWPLLEMVTRQKEIEKMSSKEEQSAAWQALRDQGLLMTERLRIGKDQTKASIIKMKDAAGKVRIELKVEASGVATLSFLDEEGNIVYRLPPPSQR